jgi:hypothetical protein
VRSDSPRIATSKIFEVAFMRIITNPKWLIK